MFFGRGNSIVLTLDYEDAESFSDLEELIGEVRKYYRFTKLSEVLYRLKNGKSQGCAVIVLKSARKGVLLKATPFLLSEGIPFTIFLDVDSIGLNRLPLGDELDAYRQVYPEKITENDYKFLGDQLWSHPMKVEEFLKESREKIGPLPIEQMDPLRFFATWGKLIELPPELREFGVQVNSEPSSRDVLKKNMDFIRAQIKSDVQLASILPKESPSSSLRKMLLELGIEGCLVGSYAEVNSKTDPFRLPVWKIKD